MKKLILLSVAIAAFITSCTKTKYVNVTSPADTVTTIQTDTVVKIDSGLLGKWKSVSLGYSNWNLRFANDSLTIAGEAEPYLASSDTIYAKFTSVTISYWFEYRLSPDGDTLTLNNPTSGEFNIKFYKVY